jgi:hypothetical protein
MFYLQLIIIAIIMSGSTGEGGYARKRMQCAGSPGTPGPFIY